MKRTPIIEPTAMPAIAPLDKEDDVEDGEEEGLEVDEEGGFEVAETVVKT